MLELLIRIPSAAVEHLDLALAHHNAERKSLDLPPLTTHEAFGEALVELAGVAAVKLDRRGANRAAGGLADRGVSDDFEPVS